MADNEKAPDYDAIGVELAKRMQYDGLGILLVARAALTDANFHEEVTQLDAIIAKQLPY